MCRLLETGFDDEDVSKELEVAGCSLTDFPALAAAEVVADRLSSWDNARASALQLTRSSGQCR
jgi:hypothetical protein